MITLSPPIDETKAVFRTSKLYKNLIGVIICPSLSGVVNDDGRKTQKRALTPNHTEARPAAYACIIKFSCIIIWLFCFVLQYPGCQEACRFHHETPQQQQAEPVILTRGEEVLTLTTLPLGAGVVRWPPMSRQNVVYVLMARPAGASSWRQISQVSFLNMQMMWLVERDTCFCVTGALRCFYWRQNP